LTIELTPCPIRRFQLVLLPLPLARLLLRFHLPPSTGAASKARRPGNGRKKPWLRERLSIRR
jgi:hypothetical protein